MVVPFSGNVGRGGKPCRLAIIPDSSAAELAGSLSGATRNTELIGYEALILSVAPPVNRGSIPCKPASGLVDTPPPRSVHGAPQAPSTYPSEAHFVNIEYRRHV